MSQSSQSNEKTEALTEKEAEQSAIWLHEIFSQNPELLSLRERVLPWTEGYSFAQAVHTDSISTNDCVNRLALLELIYQHLYSIGMYQTAEILQKECGHELQIKNQPWHRTDLHLLSSMGVLYQEDVWDIPNDPNIQFTHEYIDEDYYASPFHEDYSTIWKELSDPNLNVSWEANSQKHTINEMSLASLRRLVVFLVTSEKDVLPDEDLNKFLLIMPSITSSFHFLEHLKAIFNLQELNIPDPKIKESLLSQIDKYRINVLTFIKKWLYYLGLFIGKKTISHISDMCRDLIEGENKFSNKTIIDLAKSIKRIIPTLEYGIKTEKEAMEPPQPIIPDPNIIFSLSLSIIDPEPSEVARQISLVFHGLFKSIPSREFVLALSNHLMSHLTPALMEFFQAGKKLKLLILETLSEQITEETVKKLIAITRELIAVANFEAASIVCKALSNKRLAKVSLMQKFLYGSNSYLNKEFCALREQLEFNVYNKTIISFFNSRNPGIPNLHAELLSLEKNSVPSFPNGKINIKKQRKLAVKVNMLYGFQNKPYNFYNIPQIQKVIIRGPNYTKNRIYEKIASKT